MQISCGSHVKHRALGVLDNPCEGGGTGEGGGGAVWGGSVNAIGQRTV